MLLRKKGDLKKWVQDVGIDKRGINMEEKIVTIVNKMADYLNISQMKKLQEVLLQTFSKNTIQKEEISNDEYLRLFLDAKRIEGCSERTIKYYSVTVVRMLQKIETPVRKISTEEIRKYLVDYQKINDCSKVTVDNVRRNISSFFSWLEEEDYILKSPMRRIHKIKTKQPVKEIISDEAIELLRDHCQCPRDLAMIDLLYSTGIRVGELVNLNISDIDFEARECIVFGKGDKERKVYFDAKAKLHLLNYLHKRDDDNPALFVTLDAPHDWIFYAKWKANLYTITFDSCLGITVPTETQLMTYDTEDQLTLLSEMGKFKRPGYTFAGWSREEGGAVEFTDGQTVKNVAESGNITLYAVWDLNTYTIKYDLGAGGISHTNPETYSIESGDVKLENPEAKEGYQFLGWFEGETPVTEIVKGTQKDYELKAKWVQGGIYNLSFEGAEKTTLKDGSDGYLLTYKVTRTLAEGTSGTPNPQYVYYRTVNGTAYGSTVGLRP